MRLAQIILLILIGVFLAQLGYYYVNLPETIASHYNASGDPNGWMPKGVFMIFEIFIFLLIVGHGLLVPLMIKKLPDSMINLPNKQYWLAPERRDETIIRIKLYFEWFSVALLMVFILLNQLVFRANLNRENFYGPGGWLIIGGFLAFVVVWLISLVRKFTKPV